MSDKEFNLLDERWIRVIDRNCKVVEVSLMEVFRDAHLYQDLCGELSTQDFAVMRGSLGGTLDKEKVSRRGDSSLFGVTEGEFLFVPS